MNGWIVGDIGHIAVNTQSGVVLSIEQFEESPYDGTRFRYTVVASHVTEPDRSIFLASFDDLESAKAWFDRRLEEVGALR